MKEETRTAFHYGVNFLVAPVAALDSRSTLAFESKLEQNGVGFENREKGEHALALASAESRVRVRIADKGPQVSQLTIVAPEPNGPLDLFIKRAEAVCSAFVDVWKGSQVVVHRDATIRHLYEGSGDHSFKLLWEHRLRQQASDLATLGRPVLGGGLRLVMPPRNPEEAQIELRVESFLRDPRKLFVEVQFAWQAPMEIKGLLDPGSLLTSVEKFATNQVVAFIRGEASTGDAHA